MKMFNLNSMTASATFLAQEKLFAQSLFVYCKSKNIEFNEEIADKGKCSLNSLGIYRLKNKSGGTLLRDRVEIIEQKFERLSEQDAIKKEREEKRQAAMQQAKEALVSPSAAEALHAGAHLMGAVASVNHAAASFEAASALGEASESLSALTAFLEAL